MAEYTQAMYAGYQLSAPAGTIGIRNWGAFPGPGAPRPPSACWSTGRWGLSRLPEQAARGSGAVRGGKQVAMGKQDGMLGACAAWLRGARLRPRTGSVGEVACLALMRSFTGSRAPPRLLSSSDALSMAAETAVGISPHPGGTETGAVHDMAWHGGAMAAAIALGAEEQAAGVARGELPLLPPMCRAAGATPPSAWHWASLTGELPRIICSTSTANSSSATGVSLLHFVASVRLAALVATWDPS
mmetsp:Transcript_22633/g.57950  ORF Transcript_22633/g.57950 Transcript_22633/m.57950 type:complete len:244 (-) Transcript_22633:1367-2098(-)